jgi:tetratricopeptide (TPR) repeat protein
VNEALAVLRLVDTENGAELLRLEAPEETRLTPLCFTPDGTRLVALGTDTRALHVWDLRALRASLAELGLDWDKAAPPPVSLDSASVRDIMSAPPLRVSVDLGDLGWTIPQKGDDATCCNNQAWVLAKNRDLQIRDRGRVVELAQKAVELVPDPGPPRPDFAGPRGTMWNTLGVACYRARHWKKAIEALNRSMELSKGDGESFDTFFLAMAYWQLGEKEKARQFYDRAVQWMNKNSPGDEELPQFRAEAAELLGVTDLSR